MRSKIISLAVTVSLSLLIQPAALAETKEETFSVKVGEQRVIGSFYEIKASTCKVLPRPKVTVLEQPAHGRLIVEEIERSPRQENCSHLRVPAVQVVYQAGSAAGSDRFVYSIAYESSNLGTWQRIGVVSITAAE